MNRTPLLFVSTFLLAIITIDTPIHAQDAAATPPPGTNATILADELVNLLHLEKTANSMRANLESATAALSGNAMKGVSPDARVQAEKQSSRTLDIIFSAMSWDKMKPVYVSVYAETFTPEELRAMIAFYKTDVGQKWLEKQPQVQAAIMQKSMVFMRGIQGKIMESIKNVVPDPGTPPTPSASSTPSATKLP